MNSFNSDVFLVSSFQHLIQNSYNQQAMNTNGLRPIRKLSPQSSSQIIAPAISIPDNNTIYSTASPHSNDQQSTNKNKLRSESLSIDFNIYKRTMRGCKTTCCSFCRNNGEPEHVYMSHPFKNLSGVVVCPVLQNHKCPICGESGDRAHTITYCKEYKNVKRSKILNNIN